MDKSKIEWTDATWNPVMGCTPASPGCAHCYARSMMARYAGRKGYPVSPDAVTLFPARLDQPLHWNKPRKIFVCSMSDLFHPDVPDYFVGDVFTVMRQASQHTFQVLTKRADTMLEFINREFGGRVPDNVWLGVTAENQEQADKRIPLLLRIPAAVRFVSIEPMLGPVNLRAIRNGSYYIDARTGRHHHGQWCGEAPHKSNHIDWVICGGESGPQARPMRPDWARSLRDQCTEAGVSFFFKQWGTWVPTDQYDITDSADYYVYGVNFSHSRRVGKVHTLDGVEYKQFPEVTK